MSPNIDGGLTHVEFQEQVVEAAHVFGWHHLHIRRSIGKGKRWVTSTNVVGWPDLLLWRDGSGFLAIELKVGRDKATVEQEQVLAQLARAGAVTMVAYPDDWPKVEAALRWRGSTS